MNRKRVPIILAVFFLVQVIASSQVSPQETCILNPPTKVSLNNSDIPFEYLVETMSLALWFYKLDAIERYPKDALIRKYGGTIVNPKVRFYLERGGKKGWTRYYPFSIGRRHFIARIFLTEERPYQPEVPILFESVMQNPAVTVQILPSLNEILKECKISPRDLYLSSPAATSP